MEITLLYLGIKIKLIKSITQPYKLGKFYISIYFDCSENEIFLEKVGNSNIKFEKIMEEEELLVFDKKDDNIKKLFL